MASYGRRTSTHIRTRSRGGRKRSATKKDLRQAELAGKLRQSSNAKLNRWCNVTEEGQEPELATVIGSMNAWQQRTESGNIPVPEREPRHVLSARMFRQVPTAE